MKFACSLLAIAFSLIQANAAPCGVEIVEKGSGWPVPLVELRTVNHLRFISDNAGRIALDAPELMGRETWFHVLSPSYEVPADGFGMRGVRLVPEAGKTLRVEVERRSIARRLGRLTGIGRFGESQKLGLEPDWKDGPTLGCDSIQLATHRGHLHWAWGDTNVAAYPLGVFDMTGAISELHPLEKFEPPLRLQLPLLLNDKQLPRGLAKMSGEGPTWLSGVVSLRDASGTEHLVASYIKVHNYLEAYESGLCVWDDEKAAYQPHRTLWTKTAAAPTQPPMPEGHPLRWRDPAGHDWVLFGNPLPTLRCPATFEAWQDEKTWERLTPATEFHDSTGTSIKPHSGSTAWHAWRNRWITIFMQADKPGHLGEIWYAEATSPLGPWGTALKVLSHDNYTFYNPRAHVELTPADSPVLIFEGTYTSEFSNHAIPTPRWDYNQVLYRLDLNDPALQAAQKD